MDMIDISLNVFQGDSQRIDNLWVILAKCLCQLMVDVHFKCFSKGCVLVATITVVADITQILVFLVQSICGRIVHERRAVANGFKHGTYGFKVDVDRG